MRRAVDAATRARVCEHQVKDALAEQSAAEAEAAQLRAELASAREGAFGDDAAGLGAAAPPIASSQAGLGDEERAALVEELSSLRRAAQRAELRCSQLEAGVQDALSRVHAAEAEVASLRGQLAAANEALLAAAQSKRDAEAGRSDSAAHAVAAQAEVAALQRALATMRVDIQAAQSAAPPPAEAAAHAVAAARVARLEAAQGRLLGEIDDQAAEIERLFAELTAARAERDDLSSRLDAATSQNNRLRVRVLEVGDSQTPRKASDMQDDTLLASLRAERDALQAAVSAAVRREEALERQLHDARQQAVLAQAGALVGSDAPPALSSLLASIETRLLKLQSAQA